MGAPIRGRRAILVGAVIAYLAAVGWAVAAAAGRTDGKLVYGLDDPYIHLAIARNFTEHGVWGVTRHEFTSSSSSPLWTFLLAGWNVVSGVSDLAPLALNVVFSLAAILLAYVYLAGREIGDRWLALGMAAVALATPLPALTIGGMEHSLQALTVFAFALVAATELASTDRSSTRIVGLAALAAVTVATRYEGLFVVFVACVWLLRQRKIWQSALVGAAAWVPIGLYGAWSLQHGWPFFPVSVLLKRATAPSLTAEDLAETVRTLQGLVLNGFIPLLMIVAAIAILAERRRRGRPWDRTSYLLGLFLAVSALHLTFARTGWFFRYEAYLVFWGLLLGAGELPRLWNAPSDEPRATDAPPTPAWTDSFWRIAGVPLALALALRAARSLLVSPDAMANIHEQTFQSARFLETYYNDQAVAINDIGAVCWLSDAKLLDLYGLGSLDVARAKLAKRFDTAEIDRLAKAHGVRVAIVHDHWFTGAQSLPPTWTKVERWTIERLATVSAEMIDVYAVEPGEIERLEACLDRFAERLPAGVTRARVRRDGATPAHVESTSPAATMDAAPR